MSDVMFAEYSVLVEGITGVVELIILFGIAIFAWKQVQLDQKIAVLTERQEELNSIWRWENTRLRALEPFMGLWINRQNWDGCRKEEGLVWVRMIEINSRGVNVELEYIDGARGVYLGYGSHSGSFNINSLNLHLRIRGDKYIELDMMFLSGPVGSIEEAWVFLKDGEERLSKSTLQKIWDSGKFGGTRSFFDDGKGTVKINGVSPG